jgi:dTDP-glucose 4,6-dehydratase
VLASTSECYGDPLVHPQKEDYWGNVNPVGPRGVYDEAKRFAEAMTMATTAITASRRASSASSTPTDRACACATARVARVLPAGVDERAGDGVRRRLANALVLLRVDLIDGIVRLSRSNEALPVNIGNPHEITIREAAERVIQLCGSSSKVVCKPLPVDDPKVRQPDITKARAVLGWEPKVSLEDGLRMTLEYFKKAVAKQQAAKANGK